MSGFLDALFHYEFLRNALLAGLLAGIGCGIVGSFVVVRRLTFLAGGIAHAVLAGMGAAYFFGKSPILGALVAAVAAAFLIGWVHLRFGEREDTLIGAIWAIGMAIGILFISRTPGYAADLMSYLFGNILMIPEQGLLLMAGLDALIVITTLLLYRPFVLICFDEEFARLRGVNVEFFHLLLLSMVAVTVVLLIQVVGLILVIALLTLPAATAARFDGSLRRMIFLSIALGMICTTVGLALSYEKDLPAGAVTILLAGTMYAFVTVYRVRHKKTGA